MSDENKEKKCKKKKAIALIAILALVLSFVSLILDGIILHKLSESGAMNKPVVISKQYDKGQTMEKALKKNKPVIVWFYTDWCGFCQRFAPTFGKITKDRRIKRNFAVAYVNADYPENAALMQEYEVQGFPTVYLINPETKEKVLVDNSKLFTPEAKKELVKDFLAFADKKKDAETDDNNDD